MRIAWIAPNGGNYMGGAVYGGWVGALESAITELSQDIELGIVFATPHARKPKTVGKVTYVPVYTPVKGNVGKWVERWFSDMDKDGDALASKIAGAVRSFRPELIHVWGCENPYAEALKYLEDIPTVVHIQGLVSQSHRVYLPYGIERKSLNTMDGIVNRLVLRRGLVQNYKFFKRRVAKELEVASHVHNWMGRTDWDRDSTYCMQPKAKYFHCDELMRPEFYDERWRYHFGGKMMIQSSISDEMYKGCDVALQAAAQLKRLGVDFEWNVYGVKRSSRIVGFFSKRLGIVPEDVNLRFNGPVSGKAILEGLLSSDVYVHPSYIENSSNAIAEAMCLGMPVIAQYVGGNPTMLRDGSGVLVQANDPSVMVCSILAMRDRDTAERYGSKAREVAAARHDRKAVVEGLVRIYGEVARG